MIGGKKGNKPAVAGGGEGVRKSYIDGLNRFAKGKWGDSATKRGEHGRFACTRDEPSPIPTTAPSLLLGIHGGKVFWGIHYMLKAFSGYVTELERTLQKGLSVLHKKRTLFGEPTEGGERGTIP